MMIPMITKTQTQVTCEPIPDDSSEPPRKKGDIVKTVETLAGLEAFYDAAWRALIVSQCDQNSLPCVS